MSDQAKSRVEMTVPVRFSSTPRFTIAPMLSQRNPKPPFVYDCGTDMSMSLVFLW